MGSDGISNILGGICSQFPPGDPNHNALLYWNDTTNKFDFLGIGTGLTISGGNLTAAGGLPSGSGGAVQIANALGTAFDNDGANFVYSKFTSRLQVTNVYATNEAIVGSHFRHLGVSDGSIPFFGQVGGTGGYMLFDPTNFFYDINGKFGLGTNTPEVREHTIAKLITIPPPAAFSVSLQPESLIGAPSYSSLTAVYGAFPSPGDNGSAAVSGSGFAPGTTVYATAYAYILDGSGNILTSPGLSLSVNIASGASPPNSPSMYEDVSGTYNGFTENGTLYEYEIDSGVNIGGTNYMSGNPIDVQQMDGNTGAQFGWQLNYGDGGGAGFFVIRRRTSTDGGANWSGWDYQNVGYTTSPVDNNFSDDGSGAYWGNVLPAQSVQWQFQPAARGDGSGVNGYLLVNNSTGYSYDCSTSPSFLDSATPNSVTYANFDGITAAGQSYNFEPHNMDNDPAGYPYFSVAGSGTSYTEPYNNGSLFQLVHNLSGAAANFRLLDTSSGQSVDGTTNPFIQTAPPSASGTVTPQSYGIISDGSILNRVFEAWSYDSASGGYYSTTSLSGSTGDPSNAQPYYFAFNLSQGAGVSTSKVIQNINGAGFGSGQFEAGNFALTANAPAFADGATVTPNGLAATATIAENSASSLNSPATSIIRSNAANPFPAVSFQNGSGGEYFRLGHDNNAAVEYLASSSGNFELRSGSTTKTRLYGSSSQFNIDAQSGYQMSVRTQSYNPFLQVINNSDSMALGGNANTTGFLNLSAGSSSKAQLNYATQGVAPSSPNNGDMWFDGSRLFLKQSAYLANLLQTGVAGVMSAGTPTIDSNGNIIRASITANNYPITNASGQLVTGHLSEVSGVIIAANLVFEAKQGISIDSGQDFTFGNKYNGVSTAGKGLVATMASGNLTAQTAAVGSVCAVTLSGLATLEVGGYLNVTAIAVDVIALQVLYTDENSALQTKNIISGVATTGNNPGSPICIRTKSGTSVTVRTALTTGGGTITYDVGAFIRQIA